MRFEWAHHTSIWVTWVKWDNARGTSLGRGPLTASPSSMVARCITYQLSPIQSWTSNHMSRCTEWQKREGCWGLAWCSLSLFGTMPLCSRPVNECFAAKPRSTMWYHPAYLPSLAPIKQFLSSGSIRPDVHLGGDVCWLPGNRFMGLTVMDSPFREFFPMVHCKGKTLMLSTCNLIVRNERIKCGMLSL